MKNVIKHPVKNLSEQQWQELRKRFSSRGMVGGSDAGTLLGMNEYSSPIILYYKCLGIYPEKFHMKESVLHGKNLESYVADMWQFYDGTEDGFISNFESYNRIKRYSKIQYLLESTKYPFLYANIDRKIINHPVYGKKPGVLEVKTIGWRVSEKYDGEIPPYYLFQLQLYMIVTGYKYGEIVYLKDGQKIGVQTFDADINIQNNILAKAEDFYKRVQMAKGDLEGNALATDDEKLAIAAMYEPEADGSTSYTDYLNERHKNKPNPNSIVGTDTNYWQAQQYLRYKELEKRCAEKKSLYMNQLKSEMDTRSANEMILKDGKIKWNKQFIVTL